MVPAPRVASPAQKIHACHRHVGCRVRLWGDVQAQADSCGPKRHTSGTDNIRARRLAQRSKHAWVERAARSRAGAAVWTKPWEHRVQVSRAISGRPVIDQGPNAARLAQANQRH